MNKLLTKDNVVDFSRVLAENQVTEVDEGVLHWPARELQIES